MKKFLLTTLLCFTLMFVFGCTESANIEVEEEDILKLQKESEHFLFYSFNKDKKCLDDLVKSLESNYQRITDDLGHRPKEKIRVDIYPDIVSLHEAIGRPNSPQWVVGTVIEGKIQMVSPLNPGDIHDYESLMKVITHEFTHVICGQINPAIVGNNAWLNEGIAVYEAKQMDELGRKTIRKKIDEDIVPSLSQLNTSRFAELGGYIFSYTIIEYIVENYGHDAIREIIRSPEQIEEILGVSKLKIEQQWLQYIEENY